MSALYELRDIVQEYGGREVLRVPALDVPERGIMGLAGPNGSGKSTLLRLLAFLEAPAGGEVGFRGRALGVGDEWARREVTLMTQEPYLLRRGVAANVGYGLKVRGVRGEEARGRVESALDMVGLPPELFARRSWRELSGGEAQRVALAARLVLRPRVLLLDEPTASLDEESAERIHDAALTARERWGTTLVVVSHDAAWLERVCDVILRLSAGRMVADSPSA
ncbi:ATP-binding cassette domain-containing protein [Desulfocurvus sp. DL9XJH121]